MKTPGGEAVGLDSGTFAKTWTYGEQLRSGVEVRGRGYHIDYSQFDYPMRQMATVSIRAWAQQCIH